MGKNKVTKGADEDHFVSIASSKEHQKETKICQFWGFFPNWAISRSYFLTCRESTVLGGDGVFYEIAQM